MRHFLPVWEKLFGKNTIIDWVKGYKIPFSDKVTQAYPPRAHNWSVKEKIQITEQINELKLKEAIEECENEPGQFISKIFLIPKPDGSHRLILNLKELNEFISTKHFKLEDIRTVRDLIYKDCFMATLDMTDAYYSISILRKFRKYLRFEFNGKLYEFTCLPFCLNTAPYVFTKILKPVFSLLRQRGFTSVGYLDDVWLVGKSAKECTDNLRETRKLLEKLGFIINEIKSQLYPSKECRFLDFIISSSEMRIKLPEEKRLKIKKLITKFKRIERCKIREFFSMIGTLGSCCQAVRYGWVYLKDLEREKYGALCTNGGNYEAPMILSYNVNEDLSWWKDNIDLVYNPIRTPEFCMEIFSDASLTGWGVCAGQKSTHGFWSAEERILAINHLELLAAFFGLKYFADDRRNCEILLRIDNTTAIAYINRMGGTQFEKLSKTAKAIWKWCENRGLWIFASYIPSKENVFADRESRKLEPETEIELSQSAFRKICIALGNPDIDLFASRVNTKCKKYCSWKRDPGAMLVDAFTINWSPWFFYAFPPFALIPKISRKIDNERARGILVVPNWPSQTWYPHCMEMFESQPILFKANINLLYTSDRKPHPLWRQISLVAGISSSRRTL